MKTSHEIMLMLLIQTLGVMGRQLIKDHLMKIITKHPDGAEPRDLLQFINKVEQGLGQLAKAGEDG